MLELLTFVALLVGEDSVGCNNINSSNTVVNSTIMIDRLFEDVKETVTRNSSVMVTYHNICCLIRYRLQCVIGREPPDSSNYSQLLTFWSVDFETCIVLYWEYALA